MALKFVAYWLTGSRAILTDAFESIINVVAGGFAFYSTYLSGLPKDRNHPYGHGKVEFFSAGLEGVLIMLAGLFIIYQVIYDWQTPTELHNLTGGTLLILVSTLTNALLGHWLITWGRRTRSPALLADGRHLLLDGLSSAVLLIGLVLILLTGYAWIDAFLAVGLAGFIFYSGYRLLRQSVAGLMDEADEKVLKDLQVALLAARRDGWIDLHNLRVQRYGADLHIDCHLTLPYYWHLEATHDEVKRLEEVLRQPFAQQVEIFVHADPCEAACCAHCRLARCSVRQHPHTTDVDWSLDNLYRNRKHYHALP